MRAIVWLLAAGVAVVAQAAPISVGDAPAGTPAIGLPWAVANRPYGGAVDPNGAVSDLPRDHALSLAELSDFALRHNPSTRAAWAGALADLAGVDAARALLRPTVGLNMPLSFDHGAGAAGAATATAAPAPAGITRSLSPSLGLSWVLFDFGARASGVDAARWQAAASQLGYNRALQTVASAVEQAYYALLGARQLQGALQVGVNAARASLDAVQARRRAGLATIGEAAQAEAAWADAQLQWVRAQATARSTEGSLAQALGLPVNTVLTLADDAAAGPAAAPDAGIDALLATARTSRADLAASNALVLQGEAQLAAARAQGRPSLALTATAGRRWGSDGDARSTQQATLTLVVPLFDGGLVRAQTQAARARVDQLGAQRDQQRASVALEVWQSFQAADSAQAVITGAEAVLRSAVVAEDATRARYRAGMGSLLELLVAQSTAAQARVSVVQARYDARLAMAQLGYAVGAVTASK